jgi:asparagine synthase (glutamine-hydrolysing)
VLCRSPFDLSELELATGLVFGFEQVAEVAPVEVPGDDPLAALERAVLPALLHPPCVVSFSGGRDSSAVLAAAVSVARREGLPLPIPATNVFPEIAEASEDEWQEELVRHLGLDDWVRLELRDELDCVGPLALSILERHGLLWPFNAHFHRPLLEVAGGGSLLTGIGGDELLATSHWARAAAVLAGRVRPVPRDVLRVLVALGPPAARRIALRRRYAAIGTFPWLTDAGNDAFLRAWADDASTEPLRWSRRWGWWRGRRDVAVGFRSLDLIAADCEATIAHPLTDGAFSASVARLARRSRIYERSDLMRAVFEPLLPPGLLTRSTKAAFDSVFWGPASRRLAQAAAAALRPTETVDGEALRRVWRDATPDGHSYLLLQALALELGADGRADALAGGTVARGRRVQ